MHKHTCIYLVYARSRLYQGALVVRRPDIALYSQDRDFFNRCVRMLEKLKTTDGK
jgi:hypothetical protein